MGSKNHEVVPSSLINQISGLRAGGANKMLGVLAKRNLVARVQNAKCRYASLQFRTVLISNQMMVIDSHTADMTTWLSER